MRRSDNTHVVLDASIDVGTLHQHTVAKVITEAQGAKEMKNVQAGTCAARSLS